MLLLILSAHFILRIFTLRALPPAVAYMQAVTYLIGGKDSGGNKASY
jgi:hypothetical protein